MNFNIFDQYFMLGEAILLESDTLASSGFGLAALALAWAAWHDVLARTIPNGLAAAVVALGLCLQALRGGEALLWSGFAAAVVFLLGALAWARGWMGGGDVKLLAAASTLVPAPLVPTAIATVALAGGPLALVYLALRRVVRVPARRPRGLLARGLRAEAWRIRRGGPLPYGVAIAGGTVLVAATQGLS